MNERIKEIRAVLKISQAEMARRIGVNQNTISYMEKENSTVKDINIKAICKEFNISEDWLRLGEGEMFVKLDKRFAEAVNEIFRDEDPFIKNMIIEMANLPKEEKETMKKAFSILKKITSL